MNKIIKKIGFWSAVLSLFFALGYSVPQILSELKIIPHPKDLFWLFLPSLFLAPAFLLTMISFHYIAPGDLKIWTAIGWSFALLYSISASIVYFTQLTVVLPLQLKGEIDEKHVLIFQSKSFLMAIDCLGYFFMSLSTFFAAFAFKNNNKWLYRGMLYNGLLMPVLVPAFFYPVFYYVGALWMITFPLAMVNAAKLFRSNKAESWKQSATHEKRSIRTSMIT